MHGLYLIDNVGDGIARCVNLGQQGFKAMIILFWLPLTFDVIVYHSTQLSTDVFLRAGLQINQRGFNIELNWLPWLDQFNQLRVRWLGNSINLEVFLKKKTYIRWSISTKTAELKEVSKD